MTQTPPDHLATQLLKALGAGEADAAERLIPLVYDALEKIARNHLRHERPNHTLDTSALVHEAYLKLIEQSETDWQNRLHFFAIASQLMRRILISYARKRQTDKRGGNLRPVTLEEERLGSLMRPEQLLDLDEALDRLALLSQRQAQVVVMRFFGGLKEEEIAIALGISGPTVRRDWRFAKAWLTKELAS